MPAWHRLASAVSLPDQDTVSSPPAEPTLKRKSSITDPDAKRRRLSSHDNPSNDVNPNDHEKENFESSANEKERRPSAGVGTTETKTVTDKPAPEKDEEQDKRREQKQRRGRPDEERKRGQRLFGALLGTLSQSSNSTAQRRRADIERRQQDKLKVQDEEYDELKKKRREERLVIRKKEQKLYEEEAVGSFFLVLPFIRITDDICFSDAHPAFEFDSNGSFSKDQDRTGIGMYHGIQHTAMVHVRILTYLVFSTTNHGNYDARTKISSRIKSKIQRIRSPEKLPNSKPVIHRHSRPKRRIRQKQKRNPR